VKIRASFDASEQRYGSPRIWEDLVEDQIRVSRKRVVRLMQEQGLRARARKRFKSTTMSDHDQPVAANLLNREFKAAAPNQRWVGDTKEFLIGDSGKLYLAAILDLYSRFVVGWAVSAINDRHLALRALEMALKRRCPGAGLLHHSDQGTPGGFTRSSQRKPLARTSEADRAPRPGFANQGSFEAGY
jgi:putative transposase